MTCLLSLVRVLGGGDVSLLVTPIEEASDDTRLPHT